MARIIARMISWLAGKAVVYLVILALLLGIFVVKVVPPMVVKYHEKELEKAIAELSESRALVGELAIRAQLISGEIEQRTKELHKLDEERRKFNEWWEKVKNLFNGDEIDAERKRIEAKEKRLTEEISSFSKDKRQLRIDALESWNKEKGHALCGRMDLDHIGMSGHSFGAVTTQAMAGQSYGGGRITYLEKRIDAAVMMSPSKPRLGDAKAAFGGIETPCLLLTGTKDNSPIGGGTPEDRLEVFANLTKAPAWQAVFDGATHMDFGERKTILRKNKDSSYHEAILALTNGDAWQTNGK